MTLEEKALEVYCILLSTYGERDLIPRREPMHELVSTILSQRTVYQTDARHRCYLLPGIPKFRSKVLYVPQRASLLPGTPRDFLAAIYTFATHSKSSMSSNASSALSSIFGGKSGQPDVSRHGALDLAEAWGIDRELWDRTWANLSGGEAQRIALAIAVGLDTAEVLLLDGK